MKWLKRWKTQTLLLLAVIGPGFITANVDNDAGGIYTYSFAGAQFGYKPLFTIIPMTLALIVIQEMSARMGAITGKGLSDLIREEFGLRLTFVMMVFLVATNFANVMAEFAGVASSMELFHVTKFISVPIAAAVVWLIVVKGNYKTVEKVFLTASFFYIAYIIAGVLAHPNWNAAALSTLEPPIKASVFRIPGYTYMVIGIMGATIAPWMQFYLQASIVEKGVTERDYKTTRIDILIGSIFAVLVAAFIIIACAAT
ncbi:MAG TPA: Nramp family divalent metal transporter, partial [Candidatus Angelobacter sp.]|nr:Nramp family divalent metal transporter [Candidatus Angelobacter sp.]